VADGGLDDRAVSRRFQYSCEALAQVLTEGIAVSSNDDPLSHAAGIEGVQEVGVVGLREVGTFAG
jgi:hypothetical protein